MRRVFSVLKWLIVLLLIGAAAAWRFGPYEPVDLNASFDPAAFDAGVAPYFEAVEARFDDITPGTQKRVVWAAEPEVKTPLSVLYVHGFSATSEEIRPVPDRVAAALGANLVFTRLRGHGRGAAAMAEPTVNDWMVDMAEALEAARAVGERVIVMSTSTGGTLAAAAAVDPDLTRDVAGMIFVSPNFGMQNPLSPLITFPAARHWLPLIGGTELSFEPENEAHGTYWTTRYPSVAVMPLGALIQAVWDLDMTQTKIPALFWFSEADTVVRPERTHEMAAHWGGAVDVRRVKLNADDDPSGHVIAGDVLSPGQTDTAVKAMVAWVEETVN